MDFLPSSIAAYSPPGHELLDKSLILLALDAHHSILRASSKYWVKGSMITDPDLPCSAGPQRQPEETQLTFLPHSNPTSHTLISKGKGKRNSRALIHSLPGQTCSVGWMSFKSVYPISTHTHGHRDLLFFSSQGSSYFWTLNPVDCSA